MREEWIKEFLNRQLSMDRRDFLRWTGITALASGVLGSYEWLTHEARAQGINIGAAALEPVVNFPTTFCPALVKPGEAISATVTLPKNTIIESAAMLPGNGKGTPLKLRIEEISNENGKAEYLLHPEPEIAPGPYTLEVSIVGDSGKSKATRLRSVWIKDRFREEFTFGILADYHVGDDRAKKTAPKMDFTALRNKILKELNSMRPDFVLVAGDIVYQPGMYAKEYEIFHNELSTGLSMPVFVAPGNHDLMKIEVGNFWHTEGYDFWEKYIGPPHFAFTYGRHRFIGMNTYDRADESRDVSKMVTNLDNKKDLWEMASGALRQEQFDWFREELKGAADSGKTTTVFGHHTPIDDMVEKDPLSDEPLIAPGHFLKTMQDYGVRNYFYGHKHRNESDERDTLTLECTSTSGSDLSRKDGWGFRIVEVKGDKFSHHFVEVEPHPKKKRRSVGAAAK
ncbi:metallophosphoesterase family protein [bacterium]